MGFFTMQVQAQTGLISFEHISTFTPDEAEFYPGIPNTYTINNFRLLYYTNGINGVPDTASGLVSIPIQTACDSLPMLVYCHGTSLKKFRAPSYNTSDFPPKAFASGGFITVAPDYIGQGASFGAPHLSCCQFTSH